MSKLKEIIDLPPTWLLACIAAAWWLSSNAPLYTLNFPYQSVVGWGIIGSGLTLGAYAIFAFWRFKTSVIPRQTPKALISDGPYRMSRNPIYLADLIVLAGCIVLFGAVSAVPLVLVFWLAMQHRFILPEEKVLHETFGEEFAAYCRAVRRWV